MQKANKGTFRPSRKRSHSAGGLTLIETLVAVAILTLALTVPLAIIVTTSKQTELSQERIIATFLAEDAMEYIISKKQQNVIDDDPDWLDGFQSCLSSAGSITAKCTIDTTQEPVTDENVNTDAYIVDTCVNDSDCDPLSYNTSQNYYGYGSGSEWELTKFKRLITIEKIRHDLAGSGEENEAHVTVQVTWQSRETNQLETLTLKTNIFNTKL